MTLAAESVRKPDFLAASGAGAGVQPVSVGGRRGPHPPAGSPAAAAPLPAVPVPAPAHEPSVPVPVPVVFPGADAAARIATLERSLAEATSRVELAVERLRAVGQRLAAEARADALEIALVAARRIVEGELTTNPEAQLGFIRTALRRLGDARTVKVRLAPAQAAALAAADALATLEPATTARLEIVGDGTLAPGDCVLDGDLASVDGRLDTRFEELRRSILASLSEETP
jgi:flagellar assembly protein FliH